MPAVLLCVEPERQAPIGTVRSSAPNDEWPLDDASHLSFIVANSTSVDVVAASIAASKLSVLYAPDTAVDAAALLKALGSVAAVAGDGNAPPMQLVVDIDLRAVTSHEAGPSQTARLVASLEELRRRYHLVSSVVISTAGGDVAGTGALRQQTAATATSGGPFVVPALHRLVFYLRAHAFAANCAWASGGRIEPVMRTVWKSPVLFDEAAEFAAEWERREPCIAQRVVDDKECLELAARHGPAFHAVFTALPVAVMRADVCRVLVVYYYGGIYRDLDVSWKRSARAWFDFNSTFFVGNETLDGRLCNWFFAAPPGNQCFRNYLDSFAQKFPSGRREDIVDIMKDHPHPVHLITGPAIFSIHASECGAATMSLDEITYTNVKHNFGSQRWRDRRKYSSWLRDLNKAMGQKYGDIYVPRYERRYIFAPQIRAAVTLGYELDATATTNTTALKLGSGMVVVVRQVSSSGAAVAGYEHELFAAHNAVDGNVDTFAHVVSNATSGESPWWVLELQEPLLVGGGARGSLVAVRVLHTRDNPALDGIFMTRIALVDASGVVLAVSPMPIDDRIYVLHWWLPSNATGRLVREIRLFDTRQGVAMRVAEVQLVLNDTAAGAVGGAGAIATLVLGRDAKDRIASTTRPLPPLTPLLLERMGFPTAALQPMLRMASAAPGTTAAPSLPPTPAPTIDPETAQQRLMLWRDNGLRMARAVGTVTYACPLGHPLGDFQEHGLWYACAQRALKPGACTALFIGRTALNDLVMEQVLARDVGCRVAVLDPYDASFDGSPYDDDGAVVPNMRMYHLGVGGEAGGVRRTLPQLMAFLNFSRLDVLRIDDEGVEWDLLPDFAALAKRGLVDELHFEVHVWGGATAGPEGTLRHAAALEALHEDFLLVATRQSRFASLQPIPAEMPCCMKLSFVRREHAWALDALAAAAQPVQCGNVTTTAPRIPTVMFFPQLGAPIDPVATAAVREWRLVEPCISHRPLGRADCTALANSSLGGALISSSSLAEDLMEPLCVALAMYHRGGLFRDRHLAPRGGSIRRALTSDAAQTAAAVLLRHVETTPDVWRGTIIAVPPGLAEVRRSVAAMATIARTARAAGMSACEARDELWRALHGAIEGLSTLHRA